MINSLICILLYLGTAKPFKLAFMIYIIILFYQFIYHFDQNETNFILSVLSFKRELNLTCYLRYKTY